MLSDSDQVLTLHHAARKCPGHHVLKPDIVWQRPKQGDAIPEKYRNAGNDHALDKAGPDRSKIIEALRSTKHQGLLGLTTFDEKGDTLNKIITMTRAQAKDRTFPAVN